MRRMSHKVASEMMVMLGLIMLAGILPLWAEDGASERSSEQTEDAVTGEVQERGVTKVPLFKSPTDRKVLPQPLAPGGSPPAQLCHTETILMTQCKCFSQTDCQALTALFPGSCPPGSQHCEFVPMSRGTMPPLPQNLCGYQVPFPVTECSCHNQAECTLLSPFCPGACPAGSQSCTCRPMQRR